MRRWSVGHGAFGGGGVVASLDPPAREPRRVGALTEPSPEHPMAFKWTKAFARKAK